MAHTKGRQDRGVDLLVAVDAELTAGLGAELPGDALIELPGMDHAHHPSLLVDHRIDRIVAGHDVVDGRSDRRARREGKGIGDHDLR